MGITILPNYVYNIEDESIEFAEKEKSPKESDTEIKLNYIPFTAINKTQHLVFFNSITKNKFSIYFQNYIDEDHSLCIDFPPEIA